MRETTLPSSSNSCIGPFVLDASAIINLLGTGQAQHLLSLLRVPIFAEHTAIREVTRHPIQGGDHVAELSALEAQGCLQPRMMGDEARALFRGLIASDLSGGLDDGEAATIAYAVAHSAVAVPVIDERKATRIFGKRWSNRLAIGTMALLSDSRIVDGIGREQLRDAVHSALVHARMRVPRELHDWTITLIGAERVATCPSLARFLRGGWLGASGPSNHPD
jgi:predicted nucleic acid-binding protein